MDAPGEETLRRELIRIFGRPDAAAAPLDDDTFDRLARRVFARNFASIPAYAAYCRARGRTPETVGSWVEIPAVPTAAFKELRLSAVGATPERVFRTSGTTRGPERRGVHPVLDLDLYRASLRPVFRAFMLPDDLSLPFVSLMPPARQLTDSSLAFMISDVLARFGAEGSAVFARLEDAGEDERSGRIDFDALEATVARLCDEARPLLLLGTSAAFIRWFDRLGEGGRRFTLPEGSRLMDTGGFKGGGRRISADELRTLYAEWFGLDVEACVNEYGMTELLSQRYDDGLRARHRRAPPSGRKRGPGWLRTLAVDPETLDPLPDGSRGILRHVDLANLHSVAAVQTEDFGRVEDGGLVLEGRAAGAPPRGCSIAMDLLLEESP